MRKCPNKVCATEIKETMILCKPCWRAVPRVMRQELKRTAKAFGPRRTWKAQAQENPEQWNRKYIDYKKAYYAVLAAVNSLPEAALNEIKRMMP